MAMRDSVVRVIARVDPELDHALTFTTGC